MFDSKNALRESQSSTITLEAVPHEAFQNFLTYIYTGQTEHGVFDARTATDLLEVHFSSFFIIKIQISARWMQKSLFELTQLYLIDFLDQSNLCEFLVASHTFHAIFLFEECLDSLIRYGSYFPRV